MVELANIRRLRSHKCGVLLAELLGALVGVIASETKVFSRMTALSRRPWHLTLTVHSVVDIVVFARPATGMGIGNLQATILARRCVIAVAPGRAAAAAAAMETAWSGAARD